MTLSDEFEFEFAKVICTYILLRDHKNNLILQEIDPWFSSYLSSSVLHFVGNKKYAKEDNINNEKNNETFTNQGHLNAGKISGRSF